MKVKIRQDVRQTYLRGNNPEWLAILDKIAGQTLEVETEHLFKDQFNTVPLSENDNGIRVTANMVEEVIDDIRPIMQRCGWCGKTSSRKHKECPKCSKKEHLERLGTASNAEIFILEIE